MAQGRKAKPAQLHVLNGTARKDRHGHGPQVPIGTPKPPVWLPKESKKIWKELSEDLEKVGLLSLVDLTTFSLLCDSFGRYEQVCKQLKHLEDLYAETPQGYMQQSALFTIRNKLWDQVLRSSSEFGLSPASRSKVRPTDQQQLPLGGDAWEKL